MSRAEQGRVESARRRRLGLIRSLPVALGSFTIAALRIGVLGAAMVVGGTVAALFGLLWLILRWDRSRRTRRLPPGALATAGASVRVAEVAAFDPTIQLRSTALLAGDAEVTSTAFSWKPRGRYRRRGATNVVLPLGDIREVNCVRLGGVFRCDACCFGLRDGRDFVVNITDPIRIEEAMRSIGVRVTCDAEIGPSAPTE